MLFRVGKINVSRSVLRSDVTSADLVAAFARYIRGDWGEVDGSQDLANDLAIVNGSTIEGIYVAGGVRIRFTTHAGSTNIQLVDESIPDVELGSCAAQADVSAGQTT